METVDSLKAYCGENNRVVPMPDQWNRMFNLLRNTRQKPTGGWEPALPLILGAWHHSVPVEKVKRFHEHLEWAEKEGQLGEIGVYLRSLNEEDWAHFGEI
jgi:hypothetical protein